MSDTETDAAIAALWPQEWARANDPTLRNRSKARNKLRSRYKAALAFDAFRAAHPDAHCGNCVHFERMPHDSRMHCSAQSDFYGYLIVQADGLCRTWQGTDAEAAAEQSEYRADQTRDRAMIERWEREQGDKA